MLIGISGKAQSGKNTVAEMLSYLYYVDELEKYNKKHNLDKKPPSFEKWSTFEYPYQGLHQYSFGENLKKCLSLCCDIPRANFEDIDFKNSKVPWLDMTYRELLQKFGTAIRNEVSDTFWVDSLLSNYTGNTDWVITDVRFKTEAEAIKERGGFLLRIEREGAGAGNHISEIELDDYQRFNMVLENNFDSLEKLFEAVKSVKEEIDWFYSDDNTYRQ